MHELHGRLSVSPNLETFGGKQAEANALSMAVFDLDRSTHHKGQQSVPASCSSSSLHRPGVHESPLATPKYLQLPSHVTGFDINRDPASNSESVSWYQTGSSRSLFMSGCDLETMEPTNDVLNQNPMYLISSSSAAGSILVHQQRTLDLPLPQTNTSVNPAGFVFDSYKAQNCESLPSVGSADHEAGTCKPCSYFRRGTCHLGVDCRYCHFWHGKPKLPGKKARARRARRQQESTYEGNDPEEESIATLPALYGHLVQDHALPLGAVRITL